MTPKQPAIHPVPVQSAPTTGSTRRAAQFRVWDVATELYVVAQHLSILARHLNTSKYAPHREMQSCRRQLRTLVRPLLEL